jgi:hypothetical protein
VGFELLQLQLFQLVAFSFIFHAGGYDGSSNDRPAGGNGAAGVVYIEW